MRLTRNILSAIFKQSSCYYFGVAAIALGQLHGCSTIERGASTNMYLQGDLFPKSRLISKFEPNRVPVGGDTLLIWTESGEGMRLLESRITPAGEIFATRFSYRHDTMPVPRKAAFRGKISSGRLRKLMELLDSSEVTSSATGYRGGWPDVSVRVTFLSGGDWHIYECIGYLPDEVRRIADFLNSIPLERIDGGEIKGVGSV